MSGPCATCCATDLLGECGSEEQKLFVQYVVSARNEHELGDFKAFWREAGGV